MSLRLLLILFACALAKGWTSAQTIYHNRGVVTNQVVIADYFLNDGYFEVQNLFSTTNVGGQIFDISLTPYDMSATRRYTNNGTFRGLSARFENVDSFGVRVPAEAFVNTFSGKLDFADGFHFASFVSPQIRTFGQWFTPFSSVRVDAQNIVNQGLIRVGAGGLMQLGKTNDVDGTFNASNVDLKEGLLVVDQIGTAYGGQILSSFSSQLLPGTNYLNELGIFDSYWGMGTFTNMNLANFMLQFGPDMFVQAPEHRVQTQFGVPFPTSWFLVNPQSWGFTHTDRTTNIYIHAVFVQTVDTNVIADVRWNPLAYYSNDIGTDPNSFWSPVIKLSAVLTNALTLQSEESSVYIMDQLGQSTNNAIIANDKYASFFRPNNYFTIRDTPFEFEFGSQSNLVIDPTLFFHPAYSNVIVTNFYAGYRFTFDNLPYHPPLVPGVNVRDLPGRVELAGSTVDISGTGIRGEGLVSIQADQIISTTNTVIDSPNLAFDVAFTSPGAPAPLRIENLTKESVARFRGLIRLWSGTFTNQVSDVNSNVFNLLYHVTMVDATQVTPAQEVNVADFRARTESLTILDSMIVSNRFETTARDMTIGGAVELRNVVWSSTSFPNLTNLVIDTAGSLRLNGLADFGIAGRPLSNFVHRGTITAFSESIVADNVEISGDLLSGQNVIFLTIGPGGGIIFTNFFLPDAGPIYITANRSARLEGGEINTFGDVNLTGPVYKFDRFEMNSGATINLNVTAALQDTGPSAGNVFSSSNSFALNTTVAAGSLLGTEVNATPGPRSTYRFRWSMPAPTGANTTITNIPTSTTWTTLTNLANSVYSTNVPIGHLRLHSGTNTIFEFRGTTGGRALFVDLLEIEGTGITNITSLTNQLRLIADSAGSIDIYYADARCVALEDDIPGTAPVQENRFKNLAEFLNGKRLGGGTLRWVPNYNGPNSSEDVVVGSTSVRMNRPLRRSQIIDMDGDGIANAFDDLPLENRPGPVRVTAITMEQVEGKVKVHFIAHKGTYQVQYTESLDQPVWKVAASYTNRGSTAVQTSVSDPTPVGGTPRFYRLVHLQ